MSLWFPLYTHAHMQADIKRSLYLDKHKISVKTSASMKRPTNDSGLAYASWGW